MDNPLNQRDNDIPAYEKTEIDDPPDQSDKETPENENPAIDDLPDQQDENTLIYEDTVTINGRQFSVEEINAGIKDTFNCRLYYHNDTTSTNFSHNEDLILHKDIEYQLYFYDGKGSHLWYEQIYMLITNTQHPLSTEGNPLLYCFGIDITEWGLKSDFSFEAHLPENEPFILYEYEMLHLGNYTMRIDEVTQPQFEVMDTEWIENIKKAIRIYMDYKEFYEDFTYQNVTSGHYQVYMQKFFKSDDVSKIFFLHENGNVYFATYWRVHGVSGEHMASLSPVVLIDSPISESFQAFLDMLRSDPAVSLEYSVK